MPRQPAQSGARETVDTPCGRCGVPVRVSPAERARGGGRYCSRACFAAARSTAEVRACSHCGLAFRAPSRAPGRGGRVYCGAACTAAAARGSDRSGQRTRVAVPCAICGTERSVRPSVLALGAGLYCSRTCANIGKRSPSRGLRDPAACVSSTCLHCEREGMIPRSRAGRGDGRYCDRACGDAARRGEGHPHAGTRVPRADGHTVARRSDGTWDLAHRVAMEVILGRRLTRIEDVRHRNGDPGDDDPANLELVTLPVAARHGGVPPTTPVSGATAPGARTAGMGCAGSATTGSTGGRHPTPTASRVRGPQGTSPRVLDAPACPASTPGARCVGGGEDDSAAGAARFPSVVPIDGIGASSSPSASCALYDGSLRVSDRLLGGRRVGQGVGPGVERRRGWGLAGPRRDLRGGGRGHGRFTDRVPRMRILDPARR